MLIRNTKKAKEIFRWQLIQILLGWRLSVTDRPQGFSYFALYFCCVDCGSGGGRGKSSDCNCNCSSVNDRRTQFPSFRAHFLWLPLLLMQFVVAFLNVFRSANYSKHAIIIIICGSHHYRVAFGAAL